MQVRIQPTISESFIINKNWQKIPMVSAICQQKVVCDTIDQSEQSESHDKSQDLNTIKRDQAI